MAKRYVELETLIRTVTATPRCDLTMALMIANNYSTADVVEVVRCKDCKHRYELLCCYGEYDYGFCNYGERKE